MENDDWVMYVIIAYIGAMIISIPVAVVTALINGAKWF